MLSESLILAAARTILVCGKVMKQPYTDRLIKTPAIITLYHEINGPYHTVRAGTEGSINKGMTTTAQHIPSVKAGGR